MTGKSVESNSQGLKKYGHHLEDIEKNDISRLVIIEHSDWGQDRFHNAFCILQFSCSNNALLMQWAFEFGKGGFMYRTSFFSSVFNIHFTVKLIIFSDMFLRCFLVTCFWFLF